MQLICPLSNTDNDVPALRRNLKKARGIWMGFSKILRTEEIPAPVAGMFYQAVTAAVLLYGSESWCLPPSALKVLEGFHTVASRRLTGMMPKKCGETWVYPKTSEVLAAARLKTMKEYISIRRQRAAALVVRRPVLIACRGAERMDGTAPRQYWQDQGIDWQLALEVAEARNASDALVAAHADGAGQPEAAGVFIGIAAAASGAARRSNPWSVQRRTNPQRTTHA